MSGTLKRLLGATVAISLIWGSNAVKPSVDEAGYSSIPELTRAKYNTACGTTAALETAGTRQMFFVLEDGEEAGSKGFLKVDVTDLQPGLRTDMAIASADLIAGSVEATKQLDAHLTHTEGPYSANAANAGRGPSQFTDNTAKHLWAIVLVEGEDKKFLFSDEATRHNSFVSENTGVEATATRSGAEQDKKAFFVWLATAAGFNTVAAETADLTGKTNFPYIQKTTCA